MSLNEFYVLFPERKYSAVSSNNVDKRRETPNPEKELHQSLSALSAIVGGRDSVATISNSRSNSAAPSPGVAMFNSTAQQASATPALSYSLGKL